MIQFCHSKYAVSDKIVSEYHWYGDAQQPRRARTGRQNSADGTVRQNGVAGLCGDGSKLRFS